MIEEEGDEYEEEMNEILEYHAPFYELFVQIEEKLSLKSEARSAVMSPRSISSRSTTSSVVDESIRGFREENHDEDGIRRFRNENENFGRQRVGLR